MKNTEKVEIVFQMIIMWIMTYGVSELSTSHIRTDNWLFGVILIPVSVFIGAIAVMVTVKGTIKIIDDRT